MQLTQLRTKEVVAHAGLSPQLQPWKVLTKFRLVNYYLFQNNNSLTVLHPLAIKAAMEGGLQTLSNTTKHTLQCQNLLILILVKAEHASTLPQTLALKHLVIPL